MKDINQKDEIIRILNDNKVKQSMEEFATVQKFYVNTVKDMQKDLTRVGIVPQKKIDAVYSNRLSTGVTIKDGDRNKFLNYFTRF